MVGAAPAGEDAAPGIPVRQAALQNAIAEGVERVALELLGARPGQVALPADLAGRATAYALSYRLLEDRGERRALLVREPDVELEYVVLVEVEVDADRVQRRLRREGLLGQDGGPSQRLRVEVSGVGSWPLYEAVQDALADASDAGVAPLEFLPGRVVFEVEVRGGPDALARALRAGSRDPALTLRVLSVGRDGLSLRASSSDR